jgi:hypothetical protein
MTSNFQRQAEEQLHSGLGGIGGTVHALLSTLQEQGAQAAKLRVASDEPGRTERSHAQRIAGERERLTGLMGSLVSSVAETNGTTQATVERLNWATGDSIARLCESADMLDAALGLGGSLNNMRASSVLWPTAASA